MQGPLHSLASAHGQNAAAPEGGGAPQLFRYATLVVFTNIVCLESWVISWNLFWPEVQFVQFLSAQLANSFACAYFVVSSDKKRVLLLSSCLGAMSVWVYLSADRMFPDIVDWPVALLLSFVGVCLTSELFIVRPSRRASKPRHDKGKPHRSYSLQDLLLVVTAACVWIALLAQYDHSQLEFNGALTLGVAGLAVALGYVGYFAQQTDVRLWRAGAAYAFAAIAAIRIALHLMSDPLHEYSKATAVLFKILALEVFVVVVISRMLAVVYSRMASRRPSPSEP